MKRRVLALCLSVTLLPTWAAFADDSPTLKVLFLGDVGHHRPADRFAQLKPVMTKRGIELTYSDRVTDLNPKTLQKYDCLVVYANITRISPEQEKAMLDYVASGKGFVPLHCASYCFLNSAKYVELVGAQFQRHGTGVFRTTVEKTDHPLMKDFSGFESWDETYVHHRHNDEDRTVLAYRVDENGREPWTWIRTHGKGRVFYTAWGHDQRTWSNPGFLNLVERGIRWAAGGDPSLAGGFADPNYFAIPEMTPKRSDVKPFEYVDAPGKIPHYPAGKKWGVLGQSLTKMQRPLPAEESVKHFSTPVGFKVELFAADPDIKKPVCMAWDHRGRLWIGETIDYPNQLQPAGQGRDRIKICEDTNGDGRADKFTIFADKLSIPTAIAFWRGGAIVQNGTETLYLKDTDGDDRADQRDVLFSGWAMGDTHGGVSNFQYGLDNHIWAMQGYNNSQPVVKGKPHPYSFRMGFFRFEPDGSKLEFLRSTNNNTWGLGISEDGIIFGSTANRNPSVYMPIPNRYYERVRGWSASQLGTIADNHLFNPLSDRVRQVDQHGGYTAGAGHALYTARAYPKQYWNRTAFVCGPTGKLVGTFVLNRDGADFRSTSPCNLLASDDEWSAPIMAEVGPDGQVWVIDWYNYVIQHNPTPAGFKTGKGNAYESKLRDKRHGRIYRVVYEAGDSDAPIESLAGASPQNLVAALASDNMLWRKHAQRLLVERGKLDVLPELVELAADQSVDEIGLNVGAIHALWTMHGLGALDGSNPEAAASVAAALRHPSASVRRNAVQVMPKEEAFLSTVLEAGLLADDDRQVQLAALLALADMPKNKMAGEAVATLLTINSVIADRWIADAATSAAAVHDLPFLMEVARNGAAHPRAKEIVRTVAEHFARGKPEGSLSSLASALTTADNPALAPILEGMTAGWPQSHPAALTKEAESQLIELLPKLPVDSKVRLLKLAALWRSERFESAIETITASLKEVVGNEEQPDEVRINAARQIVEFQSRDAKSVEGILDALTPRSSPKLSAGLIESLGQSESATVGELLVQRISSLAPSGQVAAQRVLLQRPQWTLALLAGVEQRRVTLRGLSLDQKQSLANHPNKQIAARAKKVLATGGGLPDPNRQKVLEELTALTKQTGEVAAGKEVFKKQCAKCHMHSGEGNKIGPDLTGMAVHPKIELLTQIIDPSRSVEGNYRVYTVATVDGLVLNGLLASETGTTIELFDSEGKKHTVLREDIDELIASPKSLMPEGFEKQVKAKDIVNLLEFLTARGRFLPLPLAKSATIISTQGMFFSKESTVERMVFPDWSPKQFAGVPFHLVDPNGDRVPNVVMLRSPNGAISRQMPKSVAVPCNSPAKAIHMLSGVSGWGHPAHGAKSVSMIVRLKYEDGQTEDHELRNGVHFADYIRRVDVPESKFAFKLRGQQLRYLAIYPQRAKKIMEIELVKGPDPTAPIVMAITVESP